MTGRARSMRPGPSPGIQPTRPGAAAPNSCQPREVADCSTASRRNRYIGLAGRRFLYLLLEVALAWPSARLASTKEQGSRSFWPGVTENGIIHDWVVTR